ncbi:hypothetical protein BC829DRAFT_16322 [Chytridium lagenaria]|nr:hypothetical protein BC829DRAFT_16322 [Chytridium lagenaria]
MLKVRRMSTGNAKITEGYNLPAKKVIHAVGPMETNPKLLGSCYLNSLNLCLENKLRTLAFPCISTGIYGYPNDEAAHVALSTVRSWIESHIDDIDLVVFCVSYL